MYNMYMRNTILKSSVKGFLAAGVLVGIYFSVVILISGASFALSQFLLYWYFIMALALGFGIQVGLYTYLRNAILERGSAGKVLAVSGTTSTVAMISCCAHYLANILPLIGTAGVISLIGQYQVEFFWVGLIFNAAGIVYIAGKINKFYYPDNSMKKIYIFGIIFVVGLIILGAFRAPKDRGPEQKKISDIEEAAVWESKTSAEGAITVTVTPKSLTGGVWNFEISLSTHSVELNEDLTTAAVLIDESGKEFKPISWEGDGPGGHHRKGVLKFGPILPLPKSITLKIDQADGNGRAFTWQIQ